MANQQKLYPRFTASDRMEHVIMIVSFTMLAVTGLPQRYADAELAKSVIAALGGIESTRFLHRFFATLLMLGAIYHGGALTYKVFVQGSRLSMLPTPKDAFDAINYVLYNLGLRKEHPKMPRYNFGEKAEYLALVWGTVLMIITGFMMWNPVATAKLLPGAVIPIARYAHSAEAFLAVLSIIIWHMYNVHIKRFNRAMFTGTLPRDAMEEEHAAELEEIESGNTPTVLPEEVQAKRRRIFWPYATVMTIVLCIGLFLFVTFEETALETVPRRPVANITTIDPAVGEAAAGAELWQAQTCGDCHGAQGEGVPPIPAIRETALDPAAFTRAVRTGPADMPAFGPGEISDEELAHLYVYLTSTSGETGR